MHLSLCHCDDGNKGRHLFPRPSILPPFISRMVPIKLSILAIVLIPLLCIIFLPSSLLFSASWVVSAASFSDEVREDRNGSFASRRDKGFHSSLPLPPAELHFSLVDELSAPSASWRVRFAPAVMGNSESVYEDKGDVNRSENHRSNPPPPHNHRDHPHKRRGHGVMGEKDYPMWLRASVEEVVSMENQRQYRSATLVFHPPHSPPPPHGKQTKWPSRNRDDEYEDEQKEQMSQVENNKRRSSSFTTAQRTGSGEEGKGRVDRSREERSSRLGEDLERMVCEEYNLLTAGISTITISSSEHSFYEAENKGHHEEDEYDEEDAEHQQQSLQSHRYEKVPHSSQEVAHRWATKRRSEPNSNAPALTRLGRCFFVLRHVDDKQEGERRGQGGAAVGVAPPSRSLHHLSHTAQRDVEPFFTYRVTATPRSKDKRVEENENVGRKGHEGREWSGGYGHFAIHSDGEEGGGVKDEEEKNIARRDPSSRYPYPRRVADVSSNPCTRGGVGFLPLYFHCSITTLNQMISVYPPVLQPSEPQEYVEGREEEEEKRNGKHTNKRGNIHLPTPSLTRKREEVALPLYTLTILEPEMGRNVSNGGSKGADKAKGESRKGFSDGMTDLGHRFEGEVGKEYHGFTSFFRIVFRISQLSSTTTGTTPSPPQKSEERGEYEGAGSFSSSTVIEGDAWNTTEKQKLELKEEILQAVHFLDFDIQLFRDAELFPGARKEAEWLEGVSIMTSSLIFRWCYPLLLLLLFYWTLIAIRNGIQWWYRRKSSATAQKVEGVKKKEH